MKKQILSVIFVLSFFIMFVLTGACEQYILSFDSYIFYSVINLIVMTYSGWKSGMLNFFTKK